MRSIFSPYTSKNAVGNLSSEEFENKIKNDPQKVLLDVRTVPEHEEVRIPGSVLIDLYSHDFRNKIESLDKSKSYYLYCRSGNRSQHAAQMMIQMGYENVSHLAPGIIGWYGEVEEG